MANFGRPGPLFLFILLFSSLLTLSAAAEGVDFTFSYTFPRITEFDAPADPDLEGSTEVHFSANGTVRVVGTVPWLIPDSLTDFHTVFTWNDTIERPVAFVDDDGDTINLVIRPQPVMPLDLSRHGLPVVHITTAKANLWDPETGIYVWGNHLNYDQRGEEWERPAQVEYYEADGQLAFSEEIGLRINGQSSRAYYQKGLRLYFDDYGNSDTLEHDFFGEGEDEFERLVLRCSRYPQFAIGSAVAEPLHRDLGHPGSRHRSVAVYLNNEYWGLYSLRERFDSKFVETTRNWADDDYVLIKDHDAEVGDYSRWEDFLAPFSGSGPFDSHTFFENAEANLDLDSYLDWILLNTRVASCDNMAGKNLALVKIGGQKWTFMTWDEDLLFHWSNLNADHLRFYSANTGSEFEEYKPAVWYSGGPWEFTFRWNNLLRSLMQNAEFKARLRQRGADLLAGPLSTESIVARIDSIASIQQPEWVNHQQRWGGSTTWYSGRASSARSFASSRQAVVTQQLEDFLAHWAQPVELSSFAGSRNGPEVVLNWHTEREENCLGFAVERSEGEPGSFEVIATYEASAELVSQGLPQLPADYQFTDPAAPQEVDLYYRLTHFDGAGQPTVHNWVVAFETDPVFDLRLNELLAQNNTVNADEAGEFDDWVEIHNPGPAPAPLDGLFLTDNLASPAKWAFPDTVLQAGEFLLVWCDEDLDQGPLHASFKLSAGGEHLGLFSGHASGNQPIDTLVFPVQSADVSLGRQTDSLGDWVFFTTPTPGQSNGNLSSVQPTGPDPSKSRVFLAPVVPNPSDGPVDISLTVGDQQIQNIELGVFDLRGRLVRTLFQGTLPGGVHGFHWDRRDGFGRPAASGVFFIRLKSADHYSSRRVLLLR